MNIISNKRIFQIENCKFFPKQEPDNVWLIMISIVNSAENKPLA